MKPQKIKIYIKTKTTYEKKNNKIFLIFYSISVKCIIVEYKVFKKRVTDIQTIHTYIPTDRQSIS